MGVEQLFLAGALTEETSLRPAFSSNTVSYFLPFLFRE
jgi:hypothetical protein